jgi:hypothetical protein
MGAQVMKSGMKGVRIWEGVRIWYVFKEKFLLDVSN